MLSYRKRRQESARARRARKRARKLLDQERQKARMMALRRRIRQQESSCQRAQGGIGCDGCKRVGSQHVSVWTDGSGYGVAGAVAVACDGRGEWTRTCRVKGNMNNIEYAGIVLGLELARELGAKSVDVHCDNEVAVMRAVDGSGSTLRQFESAQFFWVPREWNQAADALVSEVIAGITKTKRKRLPAAQFACAQPIEQAA